MRFVDRTEDEADSTVSETTNSSTVLDINPSSVKFYIGGVPDDADIDDLLANRRFDGCIEEVAFDGVPVGLWNFVDAYRIGGCNMR